MQSITTRTATRTLSKAKQASLKPLLSLRLNSTLVSFENEPDVTVTSVGGTVRVISLNRPSKLNALSSQMFSKIAKTIAEYNKSTSTDCILVKSSHNSGNTTHNAPVFSAGADIVQVVKEVLNNQVQFSTKEAAVAEFFTKEYSLNNLISESKRPVIVIMDGLTYGAGVGLSTFSPLRVATENTRWSMPEMNIGFFPDCGVSYTLPQQATVGGSMGQLALYLCLTGEELNGADSYIAGFATHYINSSNLKDLEIRLSELNNIGNFKELSERNLDLMKKLRKLQRRPTSDEMGENEVFWKSQIKEIENIIGFKDFATTIEEFSSSLPENYKFKYSLDELNIIEKFFKVDSTTSLTKIMNSLQNVLERKSQYNETTINFVEKTLAILQKKSQISLQIAIEQFKRNIHAPNASSALKQDLVTAINMTLEPSTNDFVNTVNHKFIEKKQDSETESKTTETATLSKDDLYKIYAESPLRQVELTKYKIDPFDGLEALSPSIDNYGLPTEKDIENYILGNDNTNRSVAPTTTNIISYFTKYSQGSGKIGTSYLLKNLIIPRKCKVDNFTKTVEWEKV